MKKDRQSLQKIGVGVLLTAIALLSVLWLAELVSSPARHAASIADLDEKKLIVMELTAATAATSVVVSAIPGDATTPLANQISELSSYLLLVVGAIMLEKVLLTLTGYIAFSYLIPAACILGVLSLVVSSGALRRFALKLAVFGLMLCLVIPVSLRVSRLVEDTFELQQTVDRAEQAAGEMTESDSSASKSDGNSTGSWFGQLGEQITSGVSGAVEQAKAAMSSFIDAVAALLIVNCVIPILVLWFFLWLMKAMLGGHMEIPVHKLQSLAKRGKGRTSAGPDKEDADLMP